MDYRNRDYFLVQFNPCSYNMRMDFCKINVDSLKIHSPYNHFKEWIEDNNCDSYHKECGYVQMLMSCKKNETGALIYELDKAVRRDGYSHYLQVDKNVLGQ